MVRPSFFITDNNGEIETIYPPLQWNECISKRKMLSDCRSWIHCHRPNWAQALVNLMFSKYTEVNVIKRGGVA